jgi:hypothetical protein
MLMQIDQLCVQFEKMFRKVPFDYRGDQLLIACRKVNGHINDGASLLEDEQIEIVGNIVAVVNDRIAASNLANDDNPAAVAYFRDDTRRMNSIMDTMHHSLIMQVVYHAQMILGVAHNFLVQAKDSLFFLLGPLSVVASVFILISNILPMVVLFNQFSPLFFSAINSFNRRLINGCQLFRLNISSEGSLFFINKTYGEAKVTFFLLEYLGCYLSRFPAKYRGRRKLYFLLPNQNPVVVWQRAKQLASLDLERVISFVKHKDSKITVLRKALDLNDQVGIDLYFDLSINRISCTLNFSMLSVAEAEQQIARIESHWIFKNNKLFDAPVSTSPLLSWGVKTMNINSLNNFIGKNKPRNSHEGGRGPKSDNSLSTISARKVSAKKHKDSAVKKAVLFRAKNTSRQSSQKENKLVDDLESSEVKFIISENVKDPQTFVCDREAIANLFYDSHQYCKRHIDSCFNLLQHRPFKKIQGSGKQIVGDHEPHKGVDLVPDNPNYTDRAVKIKWRSGQRVVFRQSSQNPNNWYATVFYLKSRSGVARCQYPELVVRRTLNRGN